MATLEEIRNGVPLVYPNDTASSAPLTTLSSAGGTSLVNDGTGPALATKGLTAGSGITLVDNGTDVEVSAAAATTTTLASAGGSETLVQDGTGPALATKGLTAGTGISLTGGANDVTIANTDGASTVTLSNAGGSETLINDGVGPALALKGLIQGTGISISGGPSAITITNTAPATGGASRPDTPIHFWYYSDPAGTTIGAFSAVAFPTTINSSVNPFGQVNVVTDAVANEWQITNPETDDLMIFATCFYRIEITSGSSVAYRIAARFRDVTGAAVNLCDFQIAEGTFVNSAYGVEVSFSCMFPVTASTTTNVELNLTNPITTSVIIRDLAVQFHSVGTVY